MKSWKTTVAGFLSGLCMIIGEIVHAIDSDPNTVLSLEGIAIGLGLMGIGWFSRDFDKSSEEMGVGK